MDFSTPTRHGGHVKLLWFHLMPYPELPEDFNKKHRSVWVDIDPGPVRSGSDRRGLRRVHRPARVRRGVRVRRHLHQRAPRQRLRADAVAEPLRLGPRLPHVARRHHDPRQLGGALQPAGARRRGDGDDRPHVARPADRRLPGRHVDGHRLRLQREPGHAARRSTRRRSTSSLRAWTEPRAVRVQRTVHPDAHRERDARGRCSSRTRRSGSPAAARSRRGTSARGTTTSTAHCPTTATCSREENVGNYWRRVEANGKDPNPHRLAFVQFIGVGDTDAEAYKLYKEPAEYFFNRSLHVYAGYADPPGYVTEASVRARYKSAVRQIARTKQQKHDLTWDEMVEKGYVVIGSPDTVRETLEEVAQDVQLRAPAHRAALRQHERRAHPLQHQALRRQGGACPAHDLRRRGRPVVAGERDGRLRWRGERDLLYLFGIAGHPGPLAVARAARGRGLERRRPSHHGLRRRAGTSSHPTTTSAGSRSCGTRSTRPERGCRAPSSARRSAACSRSTSPRYRPEAVSALALLAPFGIFDDAQPGHRPLRACRRPSAWTTCSRRACPSRSSIGSASSAPTTVRSRAT